MEAYEHYMGLDTVKQAVVAELALLTRYTSAITEQERHALRALMVSNRRRLVESVSALPDLRGDMGGL